MPWKKYHVSKGWTQYDFRLISGFCLKNVGYSILAAVLLDFVIQKQRYLDVTISCQMPDNLCQQIIKILELNSLNLNHKINGCFVS